MKVKVIDTLLWRGEGVRKSIILLVRPLMLLISNVKMETLEWLEVVAGERAAEI
jgi:hypothetical protein